MKERLVDKYRPSSVDEYIFQNPETENTVRRWISNGICPHVLMVSKPGQGKTTLSRVLVNELGVHKNDVKVVNASTDRGIGFIRETLEPWMRKSPIGDFKIVCLEEMDQLTTDASLALRSIIEDYSDYVRFIATANYENKIDPALLSRFEDGILNMDGFTDDSIIDLIVTVLENESINVEDTEDLFAHIDKFKPDIRRILSSIDKSVVDGTLTPPSTSSGTGGSVDEWSEEWSRGSETDYSRLLELTELIDNNNFEDFYEAIYTNAHNFDERAPTLYVLVAEYLHRGYTVANQRILMDALIYRFFMLEE